MSIIRWSILVPEDIDRALRKYLAHTGGEKGDLSRFVGNAVLIRLFDLTAENLKERNRAESQSEILAAIEEALAG